jgi:hypothetical protein
VRTSVPAADSKPSLHHAARTTSQARMGPATATELVPGSQLSVHRRMYWHHGIYTGNDRVVQYAGWFHSPQGLVEEISLEQFTEGYPFKIGRAPVDRTSGHEIVRRARSRLGERRYDLLRNNCEHFCNWCQLGQARSGQVEDLSKSAFLFFAALQNLRRGLGSRERVNASHVAVS